MADQSTREVVLEWWDRHPDATSRQVAEHFEGPGRELVDEADLPLTGGKLRMWKSRATKAREAQGQGRREQAKVRGPRVGPSPQVDEARTGAESSPEATHAAAAVWTSVHDLHPWEDNPRRNDHVVEAIADSIWRFGYGRAFVAWGSEGRRMIVVGHTARKAVLLNLQRYPGRAPPGAPAPELIPVRWRDDWTEAEAEAYAVGDNKLGEHSEWIDDRLGEILQRLDDQQIPAGLLGFAAEETAALLGALAGGPPPGPDPAPDPASDRGTCPECGQKLRSLQ